MTKSLKKYAWLLCTALLVLTACEENVNEPDTEYAQWQTRNEAYFSQIVQTATESIRTAKAQYGDAWEEHCDWRIFRHYAITDQAAAKHADSICVKIVERGTGSGTPLFTDSVQLNYIKRLMPSESYPDGRVIEHSGYTIYPEDIFDLQSGAMTKKAVSNKTSTATLAGETTAFMQMHIGDRWLIYIPQGMAYGTTERTNVPAYSTIVVEARLRGYYRAGTVVGAWR